MFKTQDILLSAVLKLNGHQLIDIEHSGSKGIFVFDDIPEDEIKEFDLGKSLVEPVLFNNTIKQLTSSVRRSIC